MKTLILIVLIFMMQSIQAGEWGGSIEFKMGAGSEKSSCNKSECANYTIGNGAIGKISLAIPIYSFSDTLLLETQWDHMSDAEANREKPVDYYGINGSKIFFTNYGSSWFNRSQLKIGLGSKTLDCQWRRCNEYSNEKGFTVKFALAQSIYTYKNIDFELQIDKMRNLNDSSGRPIDYLGFNISYR